MARPATTSDRVTRVWRIRLPSLRVEASRPATASGAGRRNPGRAPERVTASQTSRVPAATAMVNTTRDIAPGGRVAISSGLPGEVRDESATDPKPPRDSFGTGKEPTLGQRY